MVEPPPDEVARQQLERELADAWRQAAKAAQSDPRWQQLFAASQDMERFAFMTVSWASYHQVFDEWNQLCQVANA
jgi:hypothetical protein